MNVLDIAIIITVVAGAILGMCTGIIRAGFAAVAVIIGLYVVGDITGYIAGWFGSYDENLIKVIAYAITIVFSTAVAALGAMLVRKFVYSLWMGWTDRLAGLALGLVVAVLISGASIVAIADIAGNPEVGTEGQEATVWESAWQATGIKEVLADSLADSALVPAFSVMIDSVPADKLDFVPEDLRLAMDNLRRSTN